MRGDPSEERSRRFLLEKSFRQESCRTERGNSEPCQCKRMSRQMQHRLQKFGGQFFPVTSERLHQSPVGARIDAQRIGGKIDIAMKACSCSVIKWMRQRN